MNLPPPGVAALVFIALLALSVAFLPETTDIRKFYDQVTVVYCPNEGYYGTGWFVNKDYVITAYHVVEYCTNILLIRDPWSSPAQLVAFASTNDIAVLRPAQPPSWARGVPLDREVHVGEQVYVVGYPIQVYEENGENITLMSRNPRVSLASVSWIHDAKPLFEFTPGTDKGNSGGPVVSAEDGGVVGLVVYARPGAVNTGFYGLRMDYVAQFLDQHNIEYEVVDQSTQLLIAVGGAGLVVFLVIMVAVLLRARSGW